MKYYKIVENNTIVAIGTGSGGEEITKDEYNRIFSEIMEKAALADSVYSGEINIEAVPEHWKEEIRRRVDERIAMQGTIDEMDIPAEEALNIILGGEA